MTLHILYISHDIYTYLHDVYFTTVVESHLSVIKAEQLLTLLRPEYPMTTRTRHTDYDRRYVNSRKSYIIFLALYPLTPLVCYISGVTNSRIIYKNQNLLIIIMNFNFFFVYIYKIKKNVFIVYNYET